MKSYYPVLSIAGSDSSGGAGIQADIKTISAIGCYAMTAITAITAQNTTGVKSIQGVDTQIIRDQIDMVWNDIQPLSIKTGMLFSKEIIDIIADSFTHYNAKNIVIDPVMASTSGSLLISRDAIDTMIKRLFPFATVVTPNFHEAIELTGETDAFIQAKRLKEMGCRNVLLKGGDTDRTDVKIDYLALENKDELIPLQADAVHTVNTHGTGCTLSSAIASYLALGFDITEAVMRGKLYVTRALRSGAHIKIGKGHGAVNHLFAPRHMKYRNLKIKYGNKN